MDTNEVRSDHHSEDKIPMNIFTYCVLSRQYATEFFFVATMVPLAVSGRLNLIT